MSKMHCFSNTTFKNRQVIGALRPQCPLSFNIGDLKFRDLAKLWFSSWLLWNRSSKKLWRHF